MVIFSRAQQLQTDLHELTRKGKTIGFVPTMGALHAGHLALVAQARSTCDVVVASIFVNPTQFNDKNDYDKYPRQTEADTTLLSQAHCDAVFVPSVEEVYPEPDRTVYDFGPLMHTLEGAFRPGHFNGMLSVVNRLFGLVQPNKAFFGLKDYQQYLLVAELARRNFPALEVVGCPIVREPDGLAMSSRNVRLDALARRHALALYLTLRNAREQSATHSAGELRKACIERLQNAPGIQLEYFEICHPQTLMPAENDAPASGNRALVCAWVGGVRLIDNMSLTATTSAP